MKKLLLATLVGTLAAVAPVASAHADGANYRGACRFSAINDTTPGGALGGQDVFNGQVNALFVANDGGAISGWCELIVNTVSQGDVLDATLPGVGFVANAGRITYTAPEGSVVQLCDHVTTSAGSETVCGTAITIPVCPDQVCGDGAPLGKNGLVDSIVCPLLKQLAPTVDALPGGLIYIDPATGKTYIPGDSSDPNNLFWDCPPYEV